MEEEKKLEQKIIENKKNEEKTKEIYIKENDHNKMAEIISDEFEKSIEASLENLDAHVIINDSDSDFEDNHFSDWSRNSNKVRSQYSSPESLSDEEKGDTFTEAINKCPTTPEAINTKIIFQPILPYLGKRRLSECKEEDEKDEEDQIAAAQQASKEITGTTRRFIVTKTEAIPEIRVEAVQLRNMTPKMNSQTIHFPCSSTPTHRPSVQTLFPPDGKLAPHLDTRYFDSSLVEIRPITESTKSLDNTDGGDSMKNQLDEVWIKREVTEKKIVSIYFFYYFFKFFTRTFFFFW